MASLATKERGSGFTNGRISKVEQHGWSVKDEPGEFRLINKNHLIVDHRYQREGVTNSRVLDIARDWSWVACGTIIVAMREDGEFLVIDGQHRKLAADKRADIQLLPCMVFSLADVRAEAKGFLDVNTVRGAVRMSQKFKAMLISGDSAALAVKDMVEADGYRIVPAATQDFTVGCVHALLRETRINRELAQKAWSLCVELCEGKPIQDILFLGLCTLEKALAKSNQSIFESHNRQALLRAGAPVLLAKIRSALGYHGKGGSRVYAQGIIDVINKGRSARRLPNLIV